MTVASQRSFSGGEITPALYARVDQVKYATGLKTCRNFIVMRHGGVANRPGTGFVTEVSDSTEELHKLMPFVKSGNDALMLLFGNEYIRVMKDGVQLNETPQAITVATQADPVVITIAAHGYTTGDEVFIDDSVGMTELNSRNFKVTVLTVNTFSLQDMTGIDLDGTGYGAYVSGGTAAKVFEISSPYVTADLPELHHAQSADVITIAHPNYEPRELSRFGDTNWTLEVITFLPETDHPENAVGTAGPAGSDTYRYKVTALDPETNEESLPATEAAVVITGATQANPVVITATAHGYSSDDTVLIDSIVGMTEPNDRRFRINVLTVNTFELVDEDGTGFTAYGSGGFSYREDIYVISAGTPTVASPHVITWDAVPNIQEYFVYKSFSNGYGFIGTADRASFNDTDIPEDQTDTPPADRNPFLFVGNYPSTVTFHQQRRVFANTDNEIENVWTSRSGDFSNFSTRKPIQDDDPVTFNLAGRRVNEVQSMIDLNGTLIIMTDAGEWSIGGNSSGILTPGDVNPRAYSFNGAGKILSVLVNESAIYIQNRQNIVRDLNPDSDFDRVSGSDLTIFSDHLFQNNTLVDMDFQQIPHSIVWCVRDDGVLLGLTYLRNQEILGWHRHDFTNGLCENVSVIPEGTEDAVYVIVKREIDGNTVRYVERFSSRQHLDVDVADYIFMDSSVTVDGTNNTSTTMTLSGGTTWVYTEDLTLTSSAAFFSASDVGTKEIHITDSTGDILRCSINAFTSSTVVTVRGSKTTPTTMRNTALTTWGAAVNVVGGLWHLEGEEVSGFADAFVVANPNNPAYDTVTVTNGEAVIDDFFVKIHIGKPITSDFETLNVDTFQSETLADKKSMPTTITVSVRSTRGLWGGAVAPDTDEVGVDQGLTEFKLVQDEDPECPPDLHTDNLDVSLYGEWTTGGRGFIRQSDPVPAEILSVNLGGFYPFR